MLGNKIETTSTDQKLGCDKSKNVKYSHQLPIQTLLVMHQNFYAFHPPA